MAPNSLAPIKTVKKERIELDIHNSFETLASAQYEWDAFIEGIGGEIFLTYDWCRIWWNYYGAKRDLAIFIFRRDDEICGIIPLFYEKLWLGPLSINVIKMVGSDYVPVSFTIPVKQEYIDQIVCLLKTEIDSRWRKWHLLFIGAICGGYDGHNDLRTSFKSVFGDEFQCELRARDVQTYFSVAPNWEAQVATLPPKQRTNARRAFREAKNQGLEIRSQVASKETWASMFENYVDMHQLYWRRIGKSGHFGAWPNARHFHREVAEKQLEYDRLRLVEIDFNGQPVCYEYIYKLADAYYWFLGAKSLSIDNRIDFKWISFRGKIENAIKDGVKTVDAMRGLYEYKLLLGGRTKSIHNLFIYSLRIPARQKVLIFRLISKVIHIVYSKIWRERAAPFLRITPGTFWDKWIRIHQLSA